MCRCTQVFTWVLAFWACMASNLQTELSPQSPLHSILNLFKRAFQGPKGIDIVLCGRILPSRRLVRVLSKFPICWLCLKSVKSPLHGCVRFLEKVVESEMQVRKVASWTVFNEQFGYVTGMGFAFSSVFVPLESYRDHSGSLTSRRRNNGML